MILKGQIARDVAAGTVTVAFRRWDAPRVAAGRQFRTVAGVVEVTSIEEIDAARIDDAAAQAAGASSADAVRAELESRPGARTFRIGLRWVGPDAREELADRSADDPAERSAIDSVLDDLDRRRLTGAWTRSLMRLIGDHPGLRAADLAGMLGVATPALKRDVRRLKELGLTISLGTGYELSPRATSYMRLGRDNEPSG